jgi:EpsI family protein
MPQITQTATAVGAPAVPAKSRALANICLLAAVIGALIFAYRDALAAMVQLWNNSPMYSYGFTVPLVSAYLLWTRRSALAALSPRPSWTIGGLLLAAGLLLTVAARAGGILVVEQLAFVVSLSGSVFLLFGASYARVGWAALAYLVLMVPLWDGFTESLHEPFQHRSAAIGIWVLHLVGIPAFREGTFITLPNLQIEVARVCSGVNYLVAVIALGLPLGYVFLRDNWRRAVLLVVAVAVAAASNGLRVALICLLAYYEVGSPLHGPFHVLHGLFVSGIGFVVLFGGLRLLATDGAVAVGDRVVMHERPAGNRSLTSVVSAPAAVVLVLVFVLTGANALARMSHPVPLDGALGSFPVQLGAWTGEPLSGAAQEVSRQLWPGADAELSRRYRRSDGAVVDLYVGYFAAQHQGREMVTHRSDELQSRAQLRRIGGSGGFDASYVARDRAGVARMFWYEVAGRPETNRYVVKARTLWSAVWGAHSNGAVVVLSTATPTDAGARGAAFEEMAGLVREALVVRLAGVSPAAARQ